MPAHLFIPVRKWPHSVPCAEADPDAWFPQNDGDGPPVMVGVGGYSMNQAKTPKRICNDICPVRDECLQEAIERREQHGIWGGMTTSERNAFRRRMERMK
jgi:WhiB family redox-sensing transcriptional regulator